MILEVLTKDGWKVVSDKVSNVYGINYRDPTRGLHLVDGLPFRKKVETVKPVRLGNRIVKYSIYINPNESVWVTDREEKRITPMTYKDLYAQTAERNIYLSRKTFASFVDGKDVSMEKLSAAVKKCDTGLSWQAMSTENSERYLRQWQVEYGDFVSPYGSTIRDLQIIALRAGFTSYIERKDGKFRMVLNKEYFPLRITDHTELEHEQEFWNFYEDANRLVVVYRLSSGEVFLA